METIVFWSLMFVAIGAADFIGFTAYAFLFGKAGEELTMRLRYQSFKKYLQLEMGYFDDAFNSTGTLTARLASDASKVQVLYRPCFDLISNSLIISGSDRCPFGYLGAEHRCFRMCVYYSILF